ncbi:uncharacterized protein LOC141899054 [Tubulanus polymorphus]|uniref:uncharacterized protein LOC141899054 n=1 Tax=Tubulanus polymorphus TaxID=672921 RepID=UPI003DA5AE14
MTRLNNITFCHSLPVNVTVSGLVLLAINFAISLISNILLVVTIYNSSSLRTPPNIHLVNICVNDLLLTVNTALSFGSMMFTGGNENSLNTAIDSTIFFISVNSGLIYCCTLTSIGYFRYRTNKKPSMSLASRQKIVHRSLWLIWFVSLIFSFALLGLFKDSGSIFSTNPFKRTYCSNGFVGFNLKQILVVCFMVTVFIIGFGMIVYSYYRIFRSINVMKCCIRKKKIAPICTIAMNTKESVSTATPDIYCGGANASSKDRWADRSPMPRSTRPVPENLDNSFVVRYVTQEEVIAVEDALENPQRILKAKKKPPLRMTLSNASTISTRSGAPAFNFTDISPAADLYRFQAAKNKQVLKNSNIKRDRKSLSSAAKNGMVMVITFLVLTCPVFICALTDVLMELPVIDQKIAVLYCWILFYFNAPAYPLWYLMFSERVKKCVSRLYENASQRFSFT